MKQLFLLFLAFGLLLFLSAAITVPVPSLKSMNTTPIDSSSFKRGQVLFSGCSNCHDAYKDQTGPSLKGFQYRGPWRDQKNILAFMRNTNKFTAENKYARDLKARYGSMMRSWPDFSQQDLTDLITYLDNAYRYRFPRFW